MGGIADALPAASVVFASFVANFIVDGIVFTAGQTLQQRWESYYGVSRTVASVPASLVYACHAFAGPLASALANKFGLRAVAVFGSVLSAVGIASSYFCQSVFGLYFTFGLCGGCGLGFLYLASICVVALHFDRWRAFATSVAVSGSGIGIFVMGYAFELLAQWHGSWHAVVLAMAACVLLAGVASGMLMRAAPVRGDAVEGRSVDAHGNDDADRTMEGHRLGTAPTAARCEPRIRLTSEASPLNTGNGRASRSLLHIASEHDGSTVQAARSHDNLRWPAASGSPMLSRVDLFYTGSVLSLRQRDAMRDHGDTNETKDGIGEGGAAKEIAHSEKSPVFDLAVFKFPAFDFFVLASMLQFCGIITTYNYVERMANTNGLHGPQAETLVSIIGIVGIPGRLFCGWLSDQPKLSALTVYNVSMLLGAVATVLVPLYGANYYCYLVFALLFSFEAACFATLRSVICVRLVGGQRLTAAFGYTMAFIGAIAIAAPATASAIADASGGSYATAFYCMGSAVLLSAVIGGLLTKCIRDDD